MAISTQDIDNAKDSKLSTTASQTPWRRTRQKNRELPRPPAYPRLFRIQEAGRGPIL